MQEIANTPLTDEQRKQFEKEVRAQNQERYRQRKNRKGKGEKARNRKQYS